MGTSKAASRDSVEGKASSFDFLLIAPMRLLAFDMEGDAIGGTIVKVLRHEIDSRWPAPGRHPYIGPEYDGDNPLRLAEEIDAALGKNGLGNDRRLLTSIKFLRASCA